MRRLPPLLLLCLFLTFSIHAPLPAQAADLPPSRLADPIRLPDGGAFGSLVWGDYDNDDDLDLLITGLNNAGAKNTLLLRNDGGTFTPVDAGIRASESSVAIWGDYDNDNWLDVLVTGYDYVENGRLQAMTVLYHNNQDGTFSQEPGARFQPVYAGGADWGDYDNDGDLDLLLTGCQGGYPPDQCQPFTAVYRNEGGGSFTHMNFDLPQVGYSSADWGDMEEDDGLDFVLAGRTAAGQPITKVFHNEKNGAFSEFTRFTPPLTELRGVWMGKVAWTDYDRNGGLELLVTGNTGPDDGPGLRPETHFYDFTAQHMWERPNMGLPDLWQSWFSWGEFDNDGDPDLLITGLTTAAKTAYIYSNTGTFSPFDQVESLPTSTGVSAAWGDYNRDGTLDLALTGVDDDSGYSTLIYLNTTEPDNLAPNIPQDLHSTKTEEDGVTLINLDWEDVTDRDAPAGQTAPEGITYNLRVGRTLRGVEVVSPMADLETGFLRLAVPGSLLSESNSLLRDLPPGTYFWSVQAVDYSYQASPFSITRSFSVGDDLAHDDSASLDEDSARWLDVLKNDSSSAGDLTIVAIEPPQHGALEVQPSRVRYTPDPDYAGPDAFAYTARAANGKQEFGGGQCHRPASARPAQRPLTGASTLPRSPTGWRAGRPAARQRPRPRRHAHLCPGLSTRLLRSG